MIFFGYADLGVVNSNKTASRKLPSGLWMLEGTNLSKKRSKSFFNASTRNMVDLDLNV